MIIKSVVLLYVFFLVIAGNIVSYVEGVLADSESACRVVRVFGPSM